MLDQAGAAQAAIADLQGEPSGKLSIVAPIILGQAFVGPIVARFMARYPKTDVSLVWTTRVVSPIEDGIDIVIRVGRSADGAAILTRIAHTRVHVYAPPGRCAGAIKTPRDLGNERPAALGRDLENKALVFRKGEIVETVCVPRAMVANDTRPLIEAAAAT